MAERKRGVGTLAAAAKRVTSPLFGKRGLADGAIVADWPMIVGEMLARRSAPQRIAYPPGKHTDGLLHLRVESGGLATELQHLEPVIVERINGYFGYRAISGIRMQNGPLPRREDPAPKPIRPLTAEEERALEKSLSAVADDALRERLEALGRAVLGRRRAGR